MIKVAIYCRLSQEDKNKQQVGDDSASIQNQKLMLINYCISHEWDIYNIYSDDDYAGSDRNRPEFKRLLADAEAKKFNIVLCKSQSRFTRELELVEKYIHGKFLEWGIRFIGLVDQADTDNLGNKKSRQINGLVNEWYLEDLSNNIRSVLDEHRKEGLHIGSFAVYGYIKDPNVKGHLLIDEEAADVVRMIFSLFEMGYGKSAIARELNKHKIPAPTVYKRLHGLNYHNGNDKGRNIYWQYHVIDQILRNEMYIGNMVQGKSKNVSYKSNKKIYIPKDKWTVVEKRHEPIIEKEQWIRVQKLIAQRAKGFNNNGKIGMFARKARCMYCGYSMRSQKTRQYYYLRCSCYFVSRELCQGSTIPQRELEKMVYEEWQNILKAYLDEGEIEKGIIRSSLDDKIKHKKSRLRNIEKEIEKINNLIKGLYVDKSDGIITRDEYVKYKSDFLLQTEQFNKERMQILDGITALEDERLTMKTNRDIIAQHANSPRLTYEIVQLFIDYIEIGRRDDVSGEVPVNIHWNV